MQRSVRRLTRIVIFGAIAGVCRRAVARDLCIRAVVAGRASARSTCCPTRSRRLPRPQVHIEGTAPAGTAVTAFNGATPLVTTTAEWQRQLHTAATSRVNPATDVSRELHGRTAAATPPVAPTPKACRSSG